VYSIVACWKRDNVKDKCTVLPVTYHVDTEKGRVITLSNSSAFIALKECTPSLRVYMLLPFSGQKCLRWKFSLTSAALIFFSPTCCWL
jgi:hypothetical protein